MKQKISQIKKVGGELKLPGDKSISHRAVIFSALSEGKSQISNLLESEDIFSTINCFRALGCSIEKKADNFIVEGKGFKLLEKPKSELNAGNSGTTARLISGILATQDFESTVIGDESLSKRPMKRVTEPLRLMGANIETSENGTLPIRFNPVKSLHAINYQMEIASAQVKSAMLLAAIHIENESKIIEESITRDHSERMLGCKVNFVDDKKIISVSKNNYPNSKDYTVPSDISTAAFFIVLTLLSDNSELILKNVSLNPTRTGILNVLSEMGGQIKIENKKNISGEDLGDLVIKSSSLKNINIDPNLIPNIIDEIPILSAAGLIAEGNFKITGAGELRVKESDRIKALCHNYEKLGVEVNEFEDGFELSGEIKKSDVIFESFGDHRIAMTFAILSSLRIDQAIINNFDCVKISNPHFLEQLYSISE